jgi:hypothetical protein
MVINPVGSVEAMCMSVQKVTIDTSQLVVKGRNSNVVSASIKRLTPKSKRGLA